MFRKRETLLAERSVFGSFPSRDPRLMMVPMAARRDRDRGVGSDRVATLAGRAINGPRARRADWISALIDEVASRCGLPAVQGETKMNVKKAIESIPPSENMQPEGRWVTEAYEDGPLQDHTRCLYLIAFLLFRVNRLEARIARMGATTPPPILDEGKA